MLHNAQAPQYIRHNVHIFQIVRRLIPNIQFISEEKNLAFFNLLCGRWKSPQHEGHFAGCVCGLLLETFQTVKPENQERNPKSLLPAPKCDSSRLKFVCVSRFRTWVSNFQKKNNNNSFNAIIQCSHSFTSLRMAILSRTSSLSNWKLRLRSDGAGLAAKAEPLKFRMTKSTLSRQPFSRFSSYRGH